uniref:Uncharacterized protein n=1 Tax=Avena sativa TaxID=4498 RepID=A0ACD5Z1L0_AVESA
MSMRGASGHRKKREVDQRQFEIAPIFLAEIFFFGLSKNDEFVNKNSNRTKKQQGDTSTASVKEEEEEEEEEVEVVVFLRGLLGTNTETTTIYPAEPSLCRAMTLLNPHYDVQHRIYKLSEKREIVPLRLRYHEVLSAKNMPYDEQYTPYIEKLRLLLFIHMVTRSTPKFNPATITTLVGRWRPETHTFHLRTDETTVTLQDMSMILALPIEGNPLCMSTDLDGWREQMVSLIGKDPPEVVNKKGETLRVAAGATFSWIRQNFKNCPEDADEETVMTYARVYVWYIITRTLFPDSSGDRAQWHWLKVLTVSDSKFSWGSTVLAWMYRQERNRWMHWWLFCSFFQCGAGNASQLGN